MALNPDQVLEMLDSSEESDVPEDPEFLLPHESDSEDESMVATTSGPQEYLPSSIQNMLSGIIQYFSNNTQSILSTYINT